MDILGVLKMEQEKEAKKHTLTLSLWQVQEAIAALEEARDRLATVQSEIAERLAARLGGLTFVGLDDYWSPKFNPAPVLAAHQNDPATIVLCHNPDACDAPVWGSYAGWILAGHTHGGQCKPPFLPPPMLPVKNRRYSRGEFALSGDRSLYINRGLGHLLGVRFNVRTEVTLFRLVPA